MPYTQHSFKEGILRLSRRPDAQECKLTPEEARELGKSLIKWADEQQSPVGTGWFCGYTQQPQKGCKDSITIVYRTTGGREVVEHGYVGSFDWKQVGCRVAPKRGDIIRWRYAD